MACLQGLLVGPVWPMQPVKKHRPSYMHALDGKLYFNGEGNDGEEELYVYDPAAGTTTKVSSADIRSGDDGTEPSHLHALDGKLYFQGDNGYEAELYVYFPDDLTV